MRTSRQVEALLPICFASNITGRRLGSADVPPTPGFIIAFAAASDLLSRHF